LLDLGIRNRFHLRKLQLILKSYRIRYERRKERQSGKGDDDDDEDLLSEYAPSELSAILAAQDAQVDHMSDGEGSDEVWIQRLKLLKC
jgi:hypothetical protein